MLFRSACHRAAQHQHKPPADSIWISEDALHSVYQNFIAHSRIHKRRGSFVPGPLECRKRLGKRRLGYSLEQHVSLPIPNVSGLWSWLVEEIDNTQWKWEAPRAIGNSRSPGRPAHLAKPEQYGHAMHTTISAKFSKSLKSVSSGELFCQDEVEELCLRIRTGDEEQIRYAMSSINAYLHQKLATASMNPLDAITAAGRLSTLVRSSILGSGSSDQLCLALIDATWEGVTSCTTVPLANLSVDFLASVLRELHELSPSDEWQKLVVKVCSSITADQIYSVRSNISQLVHRWKEGWAVDTVSIYGRVSQACLLLNADIAASNSASSALHANNLCTHAIKNPTDVHACHMAQRALRQAHSVTISSLAVITDAENMSTSRGPSFIALCNFLVGIPQPTLRHVLKACSIMLCSSGEQQGDFRRRHHWLSLIAELPGVENELFVKLWMEMDAHAEPLEPYLCVEPLLNQWISQGSLPNHQLVRNTFAIMHSGQPTFATLLYAVHKHTRITWSKSQSLFNLLSALKKDRIVIETIRRMQKLGMKVPSNLMKKSIDTMVDGDLKKAFRLRQLAGRPLWAYPKLAISLVRDPRIPSNAIWKLLRLPRHGGLATPVAALKHRNLVDQIIVEFAYSATRSHKVSFRNVHRYIRLLQMNGMPMTADISRALTHASLIRSMMLGKYIRTQTLYYTLSIIEEAEGTAAAKIVENIVHQWQAEYVQQQDSEREVESRNGNVLRVGLID